MLSLWKMCYVAKFERCKFLCTGSLGKVVYAFVHIYTHICQYLVLTLHGIPVIPAI